MARHQWVPAPHHRAPATSAAPRALLPSRRQHARRCRAATCHSRRARSSRRGDQRGKGRRRGGGSLHSRRPGADWAARTGAAASPGPVVAVVTLERRTSTGPSAAIRRWRRSTCRRATRVPRVLVSISSRAPELARGRARDISAWYLLARSIRGRASHDDSPSIASISSTRGIRCTSNELVLALTWCRCIPDASDEHCRLIEHERRFLPCAVGDRQVVAQASTPNRRQTTGRAPKPRSGSSRALPLTDAKPRSGSSCPCRALSRFYRPTSVGEAAAPGRRSDPPAVGRADQ
jgi:hypothetical protein